MGRSDKWRLVLAEAEKVAQRRTIELQALTSENEALVKKEQVLTQIIEALTVIMTLLAAVSTEATTAVDRAAVDAAVSSLLELELRIQQTGAAGDGGGGGSRCGAALQAMPVQSTCVRFLRHISQPTRVQEVLAMSDAAIRERLKGLAGQCAIALVQSSMLAPALCREGQRDASSTGADASVQQPPPAAAARPASRGSSQPTNGSSHEARLHSQGNNADGAPAPPAQAACAGAGASAAQAAAAAAAAAAAKCPTPPCLPGDAHEYNALLSTLLLYDVERCARLTMLNLETGEPLQPLEPGFWRGLAHKLELTADQIACFRGLRSLVRTPMEELAKSLEDVTLRQHDVIRQKEELLQQAAPPPGPGGAPLDWGDHNAPLNEEHAALIRQQSASIQKLNLMWLHMDKGIVAMNTLTPRQMCMLIASSYPSVSRIEPVLEYLDELVPAA